MIIHYSIVQVLATLDYISRGNLKRTKRRGDCAKVDFGKMATTWGCLWPLRSEIYNRSVLVLQWNTCYHIGLSRLDYGKRPTEKVADFLQGWWSIQSLRKT